MTSEYAVGFLEKTELPNSLLSLDHGLSQQGVWVSFWTPKPLKNNPQDTQFFVRNFLKYQSQAYN